MIEQAITPSELGFILEGAGFGRAALRARLEALALVAASHLKRLATGGLKTSLASYVAGIAGPFLEEQGPHLRAGVELVGSLANMVENGADPFDLRETLLAGPVVPMGVRGVHQSKSGHRFRFMPFRHEVPGGRGHHGTPMGESHTADTVRTLSRAFRGQLDLLEARTLGQGIHNAAKRLGATVGAPGERTEWGERLKAGLAPILRGRHATDIYAGMYRQTKTYERATGAQYTTFRTISDNPESLRSDEGGMNWTHPGITARRFFEQAHAEVKTWMEAWNG